MVLWLLFHKLFSFLCDRVNNYTAKPNLDMVLDSGISLKSTPGETPDYNLPEVCSSASTVLLATSLWCDIFATDLYRSVKSEHS